MNQLYEVPWPIWVLVAAGVLYPIVARLLLEYAHPRRLRIEKLVGDLCADPRLTSSEKDLVRVSAAMNGRAWPMFAIAFALPVIIILMAIFPKFRGETAEERGLRSLLSDDRYQELTDLEIGCIFAANPIMGIVVAIELGVFVATGTVFLIGSKGLERIALRVLESLGQLMNLSPAFARTVRR